MSGAGDEVFVVRRLTAARLGDGGGVLGSGRGCAANAEVGEQQGKQGSGAAGLSWLGDGRRGVLRGGSGRPRLWRVAAGRGKSGVRGLGFGCGQVVLAMRMETGACKCGGGGTRVAARRS